MKILQFTLFIPIFSLSLCINASAALLLDDFEGPISGGPDGTVDFGAGNGSTVEVSAQAGEKFLGNQSLKVIFNAVSGGYIWVARGFDLDAKNAGWLVKPEDIKWTGFESIAFYVFGSDSKAEVAFDIKDNGFEVWRFKFTDNFKGWKQIVCPFKAFTARDDWQPDNADKNGVFDFPLKSYQFEPLPEAKGVLYLDRVELL